MLFVELMVSLMNPRFYSPILVLYVRGFIHYLFFIISTIITYGFLIVSEPTLQYLLKQFIRSGVFLDYLNTTILPIIYAIILVLCIKRKGLLFGLITFPLYGWILNIILLSLAILTSSIKTNEYLFVSSFKLHNLILYVNPIPLVAEAIIPRISINIEIYNTVSGASRKAGPEASLTDDEVLRIRIYGKEGEVNFKVEPTDSIRISNLFKTHLYSYVDVIPLSTVKSILEIHCGDKLLHRVNINVRNVNYRNITFYTYLNEDYIGSSSLSVESNKQLIDAVQPVLTAHLSRLGISNNDISEIQFYTKDKIYIPSSAKIKDLPETEEFIVKVYTIDKINEFIKYFKKTDVYEIWETLVKRLEFVRNRIPAILKNLEDLKKDLDIIIGNWW